jgi:hypothetical protein
MFKRFIAVAVFVVAPQAAWAALPPAPAPIAPSTVAGAQLDTVTTSGLNPLALKSQSLLGYDMTFHTDAAQYSFPLCADASLVEVDGRTIDPTALVSGDTLSVVLRPNPASTPAACASRIVRFQIGRGPSGGECLQNYQIKQDIAGAPAKLSVRTDYTFRITVYNRPSVDCDGKAYGSAPITTAVAAGQPFLVQLTRTGSGQELMRWSISTDASGKASFEYSFQEAASDYQFTLTPGQDAAPGDSISWTAAVTDPNATPTPAPTPAAAPRLSPWPVIVLLALIAVGGGTAEYLHRVRYFRRRSETPEEEYSRAEKIKWHD